MIIDILKNTAYSLGVGVVSSKKLDGLFDMENSIKDLFSSIQSKAQLNQDIVVLLATNFKRNGFFVEFGATNGIDLSNTYLLEKSYSWSGILAEPAVVWHKDLCRNRDASLEFSCVWRTSNDVVTLSTTESAEFSTISEFVEKDTHYKKRRDHSTSEVTTISLSDLLRKHEAPFQIDYLSIDTEGSEFEILSNFDFSKYDISIITCEHNYTEDRKKIFSLLTDNGYIRKFLGLSKWDDWYFKPELFNRD
jgi:FkbM family methyltransferase